MATYSTQLYRTLVEMIRIPSTSGQEAYMRSYLERHLSTLGLTPQVDGQGNLLAFLPGAGTPLLLNAHMDRVPPGLGHQPILRDDVLYSDGTTNLGADDAAGMALILEVLRRTLEQQLPHPPLVLVFTVQEETGLCGANNVDLSPWNVRDGLVFDNAFEAGVLVSQSAAYESFDIQISGRTGHPGKDLTDTIDALRIFHATPYPSGSLANDQTRISIGRLTAGTARNAIPDTVLIEGEIRSFEPPTTRQQHKDALQQSFEQTARRLGGEAKVTFVTRTEGYTIDPNEPLVQTYQSVLTQRGAPLQMRPTFISSDTSSFRPTIRAITVSTGVRDEHTPAEHIPLAPLEQLVLDTLQLLQLWSNRKE